jgi:PhoH-like ATPase
MRKTYVLDTSVLVADPLSPNQFRGNDVIIPIFVVMELDGLKKSVNAETGQSARMASRTIEAWMEKGSITEGIYDPELDINLKIASAGSVLPGIESLRTADSGRAMDIHILQTAKHFQSQGLNVALVTRDVNLRIIAESEKVPAEDYRTDRVPNSDANKGFITLESTPETLDLLLAHTSILAETLGVDLPENHFVLVDDGKFLLRNVGGVLSHVSNNYKKIKLNARNPEQDMAFALLMDPAVELVTLVGKAGCGKTICALACALAQVGDKKSPYDKIVLAKPVVEMGPGIGFLPGSEKEKMDPWMMSFYDNLDQLIPDGPRMSTEKGGAPQKAWEEYFHRGIIEIQTLHSIRGRSLTRSLVLIDEAQNCSGHEMKTVVSRMGEGSKIVIMGDPQQIDRKFLDRHSNGLVYVADRMAGYPNVGHVQFSQSVRSLLADLAADLL